MKTLPLRLDDDLDAALDAVSAEQGISKADLVTQIVRRYLETQRLKHALQDPDLAALYQQLAGEDVALAEEGIADFQRLLEEADQP
jgi:hypothetical protein